MGNREKLQIPTIEFTPVTLLSGANSCDVPTQEECQNFQTSETQWCRNQSHEENEG